MPAQYYQYNIDDLFEAIQNARKQKIQQILTSCPDLLDKQNSGENNNMTPHKLFKTKKLGNLLTEYILRHQQHNQTKLTGVKFLGFQRPLHVACVFGNTEIVETLLNWHTNRIDINSTNGKKETPLTIACRAAHLPIAKLLLEKSKTLEESRKIKVAQKDDFGHTPIHYLAGQGIDPKWPKIGVPLDTELQEVAFLMLKASNDGDNPKEKEFGRFCMEVAISQRSTSFMKILLKITEGSKDVQDEDGRTALHFGAANGDAEIVELLLEHGAEPGTKTKKPGPYNAAELAMYHGELAIAAHIQGYLHQNESPDKSSNLQAWTWHRKPRKQGHFIEWPIHDLVSIVDKVQEIRRQFSTIVCCHLPVNSWDWVKSLCGYAYSGNTNLTEAMPSLQQTFGSSTQPRPFPEHFKPTSRKGKVDITKAGASMSERQASIKRNSPADFVYAVTLPLIDIDRLDLLELQDEGLPHSLRDGDTLFNDMEHIQSMHRLHHDEKVVLHRPRTLDNYFSRNIDTNRLKRLNNDQVLSRYLSQLKQPSPQAPKQTKAKHIKQIIGDIPLRIAGCAETLCRALCNAEAATCSDDIDLEHQSTSDRHEEHDFASSGTGHHRNEAKKSNEAVSSKSILVVSQLWLIKVGNLLVTAFPQRWDSKAQDTLEQELRGLVESYTDAAAVDPSILIHQIVQRSLEYKPSIEIEGDPLTYLEIFLEEVRRVERQVQDYYLEFKEKIGKSEVSFTKLSNKTTQCLLDINDVLHEVGMVRQVQERRSKVWEKMHGIPPKGRKKSSNQSLAECSFTTDCNPVRVRDNSFESIDRIESEAKIVQTKITDLMNLLYGQAGTETSLKSSEQARYLAIFTYLTVIFSPLSFVMSVLAIPIQSFTPSLWTEWQVAGASIAGLVVTGAICLVAYFVLRPNDSQQASQGTKRRSVRGWWGKSERQEGPTAKSG